MSIDHLRTDIDREFMEAAMRWLRAMLVPPSTIQVVTMPEMTASTTISPATPSEPTMAWYRALPWRFRRESAIPAVIVPSRAPDRDEQAMRQARQELLDAMEADPPPRFTRFCDTFEMLPFERDVMLLCLGHAVSTEIARMCAAMPESASGCPTFALAMSTASDPTWDKLPAGYPEDTPRMAAPPTWEALGPDRPLRLWRILEITQPGGQPLVSSPLRVDERIVNHLLGRDYLDDRIAAFCSPHVRSPERDRISDTQRTAIADACDRLRSMANHRRKLLVQMPGSDGPTKRLFATHITAELNLVLYRVSLDQIGRADTLETFARLWNRECYLQHIALFIDASDSAIETSPTPARLLELLGGLVFLDTPEPVTGQDTALVMDIARPTPAEQRELWLDVLADASDEWADRLAGQFNLNVGEIAEALDLTDEEPTGERLWATYRSRGRARLEGLAQRITSDTCLKDVQLPNDEKRMVEQIRDQTRHRTTVYDRYGFRPRLARGLGITALFAGESGTGKTMAAEALANALNLDLYRIDLASVVSKYIGETEKNLKRLFDAAEQSGAVLLFDEADAIFGKRSEVQDSHDRYANIEVSYLLQRMEAYEGLAILTTNMRSALDQAFLRRLRFIVTFPFPGPTERLAIWRGIFPEQLQGARQLDYDALARASLTGGQIRNIVVNGAFRAAAANGVITMELLREAARDEMRKNGRPFTASDFAGWTTPQRQPAQPLEATGA